MSVVKRFEREIKANPVKAAALGALLLVAGYFWAPLLTGMFKSEESTAVAPPPEPVPSAGAATPLGPASAAAPASGVPDVTTYDWRKYADMVEQNMKMGSGTDVPVVRDPFAASPITQQVEPDEPEVKEPEVVQPITPAELGLVLSTTLFGKRKKIAEIGGKSYTIGDHIEVAGEAASFEVMEIEPRRVVLQGDGQRYELKIPRPLLDSTNDAPQASVPQQQTGFNSDELEEDE